MPGKIKMTLALAAGFCLLACAGIAAETPFIIPAPKELKFGKEKFPLEGFSIVLQSDAPQARIAADWINRRLKQLGGRPLPALDKPSAQGKSLLIGEIGKMQLPPDFPAVPKNEQGYGILADPGKIILAGNDPAGTLYAAVTFGQMLEVSANGQTAVQPAVISDWPDFNYRSTDGMEACWLRASNFNAKAAYGNEPVPAEPRFECYKDQLDFMLSVKLNVAKPFKNQMKNQMEPKLAEKVSAYARDRGIFLYISNSIFPFQSVGTVAENKGKPEFKGVQISKRHPDDFVSWGRDDLLARQAKICSGWVKDGCFDFVYCEGIDTGISSLNYSEWNNRSSDDKKRFGDDRGAADSNVINLLYKAIKNDNPSARFVFTLYPYSAGAVTNPTFPNNLGIKMPAVFAARERKKLMDFYAKVHQSIPDDIALLYREDSHKNIEAFRKLFPGRAFEAYFEFGFGGARYAPVFATNPRFSKTFYFGNRGDIIYHSMTGLMFQLAVNPVQIMLCANYAWNVNDAGSDFFHDYIAPLKDSREPEIIMKKFVPAACRYLWGENGRYLEPLMTGGIYAGMVENPEKLLKEMKQMQSASAMEVTGVQAKTDHISPEEFISAARMRQQYDALQTARKSIEKILNQDNRGTDLMGRRYITNFYKYAVLWETYAEIWMHYLKAKDAYGSGNISAGDAEVALGKAAVTGMNDKLAETARWTVGMPDLYVGYPAYPTPVQPLIIYGHKNYLLMPLELMNKFNELEANKKKIGCDTTVPQTEISKYVKRELLSRKTTVVPTADSLTSAAWKTVPKYSGFLKFEWGNTVLKLAAEQTEFMLLHDDRNLYVGVICHTKSDGNSQPAGDSGKGFWSAGEFIELFFAPANDGGYYHLAARPDGTRYNARHVPPDVNEKWNGDWQVSTGKSNGQWTAVFTIPFKTLESGPASAWKVNVARQNITAFPQEYSCFASVRKDFHDVENYSALNFEK